MINNYENDEDVSNFCLWLMSLNIPLILQRLNWIKGDMYICGDDTKIERHLKFNKQSLTIDVSPRFSAQNQQKLLMNTVNYLLFVEYQFSWIFKRSWE